jgi:hypothetical protein
MMGIVLTRVLLMRSRGIEAMKFGKFEHLRCSYPELESRYHTLVREGTDPYYAELRERYAGEPRVKFVFGES